MRGINMSKNKNTRFLVFGFAGLNTLSLDSDKSLLYCHIIRTDGTFVIDSLERNMTDYFSCIRSQYKSEKYRKTD